MHGLVGLCHRKILENFHKRIINPSHKMFSDLVSFDLPQDPDDWNDLCWKIVSWPMYPIVVICIFIRYMILQRLKSLTVISDLTKQTHKQLIKALTLSMLLLPLGVVPRLWVSLCAWFPLAENPYESPYFSSLFLCLITIAMLNPCCTVYSVVPYRTFVRSLLKRSPSTTDSASVFVAPKGSANFCMR